jgi:hypothetical protein
MNGIAFEIRSFDLTPSRHSDCGLICLLLKRVEDSLRRNLQSSEDENMLESVHLTVVAWSMAYFSCTEEKSAHHYD